MTAVNGVRRQAHFTCQGKLSDAGIPESGSYDLQFKAFDSATVGTSAQQGPTVAHLNMQVSTGSVVGGRWEPRSSVLSMCSREPLDARQQPR